GSSSKHYNTRASVLSSMDFSIISDSLHLIYKLSDLYRVIELNSNNLICSYNITFKHFHFISQMAALFTLFALISFPRWSHYLHSLRPRDPSLYIKAGVL